VPQPCTVLIANAEVLPTLKEKTSNGESELLAFTDTDALRALEAITTRKPALVALEKMFAATPRGAALINRIKADPSLKQAEILVVSPDMDFSRFARRTPAASPGPVAPATGGSSGGASGATAAAVAAAPVAAPPLDQRGTRRAPRYRINGQVDVLVDGNAAALVDISTVGAQVVSASLLKPNQRIRVGLNDQAGDIRFRAAVAWASFEISAKGPRYRAGIEFLDANTTNVDAYIGRHKANQI
jgi:hypothetical protein